MTAALLAALLVATPAAPRGGGARRRPPAVPARRAAARAGRASIRSARPTPKATELNSAGKNFYRDGKWEEARIEYRAAETADPAFLAPRLNVACSFVRQERFAEATAEVEALLAAAYVPWAREVLEAADLGALKPRPEMARIRRAMIAAAAAWGGGSRRRACCSSGGCARRCRIPAHGRRVLHPESAPGGLRLPAHHRAAFAS